MLVCWYWILIVGENSWIDADALVDKTHQLILSLVMVSRSCIEQPVHFFTFASFSLIFIHLCPWYPSHFQGIWPEWKFLDTWPNQTNFCFFTVKRRHFWCLMRVATILCTSHWFYDHIRAASLGTWVLGFFTASASRVSVSHQWWMLIVVWNTTPIWLSSSTALHFLKQDLLQCLIFTLHTIASHARLCPMPF